MISPRGLLPLAAFLLIGLQSFPTREAEAQERNLAAIQGRVISRAGDPISEVEVTLTGTNATALSDSSGRFRLLGVTPGLVVLRVRRIGFKGQFLRVTLEPGQTRDTEIMLDPGPQLLPEITVNVKEAKPLEFGWTTKYDDFFRRRRLGLPGGTFIGAEDIRRQPAMHTADLLEQHVPALRVVNHFLGPGGTEIKFPRCSRGHVGVWVDGRKRNWQSTHQQTPGASLTAMSQQRSEAEIEKAREKATELADILDQVNPSEIQFIEVYRGIGSIPGEFSGGCGAIVIWTK